MPDPGVLAVVYGGPSAEHEISCISARRIAARPRSSRGFVVKAIGLTHDKRWVDADRVLADIDEVDALASPDDLLHHDPEASSSSTSMRACRPTRWCSRCCTGRSARTA